MVLGEGVSVALITANLGEISGPKRYVDQSVPVTVFRYDDNNFPPRPSMTPRAQAKIPKMLGWQMRPGFDYYVWVDARFNIVREDTVEWLIEQCSDYDAAFFQHPVRSLVSEEMEFLEASIDDEYISSRYMNEECNTKWFDHPHKLFAAGIFIYRNSDCVREMLKEWYFQNMRYHINDQLSLGYVIDNSECSVNTIQENIFHNRYFHV